MKLIYLFAFIPMALSSCSNNQQSLNNVTTDTLANTQDTMSLNKVPALKTGCYVYQKNGDLMELKIAETGVDVTGPLVYNLAEKDKNVGTFSGKVEGDLLVGTYTFKSEGTESKREIVFKIKENSLIEGYGESVTVGNSSTFKDKKTLEFNENTPLAHTDCK